jgi:hypothetical protein
MSGNMCNKCEKRTAVADWGVCMKCFQEQVDDWYLG